MTNNQKLDHLLSIYSPHMVAMALCWSFMSVIRELGIPKEMAMNLGDIALRHAEKLLDANTIELSNLEGEAHVR